MRTVAAICRELTTDPRHDGELLAAFTSGSGEAAFTELVRRHGPLVWGTCRRLLHDPADAEDAFQAAFLVLVRRSGELTRSPCVGPWLHRVTVWTARNVRRKNARRLARQTALPDSDQIPGQSPAPDADLKADLDAALLALPARYRDPIILCHVLGFTRREAAERLGCPEGTLSGWLNRGLAKLRIKLRGLDPAKVLTGGAVAVPAVLCANTARAAVATSVAAASVPPAVSLLVEGVLHMFWVKKATAAAFALCAVFAMGVGIGLGTRAEYSGTFAQEKGSEKAPTGENPKKTDEQRKREAMIAELELQIRACEAAHKAVLEVVAAAKKRLELSEASKAPPKDIQNDRETLARFQRNAELAAAELKAAEAELAKLKTDAKAAPPRPGVVAEIAELEKQIELHRLRQELTQIKARQAELRLAELKRANANAKDIAAAKSVLADSQKVIADTAAELLILEARLAKLKGEPAKPVASALNDAFGTPAELEGEVRKALIETQRSKVVVESNARRLALMEKQGSAAEVQVAKAKLAESQVVSELATKNVQLTRSRLAAARAMHVPPLKAIGACVEVVVVDGPVPGLCRVREYGRGGALVGSVLAEDAKALELILTRAMKDPAGPRDFWLVVSSDHSADAIVRAAKAGKAAGFTQVRLKGTVPDGLDATKALSEREFDGTSFDLKKFAP